MIYTREHVERLAPGIWDESRLDQDADMRPDPSMPKAPQHDPRRYTDRITEIADIRRAWERASLTKRQARAMYLRFGLDYTYAEVAEVLGLAFPSGAAHLCDMAVDELGLVLNGRPYPSRELATVDT